MEEKSKLSSINNFFNFYKNSHIQQIEGQLFTEKNLLLIKRDYLIHPYINGNNSFKLKYNVINTAVKDMKNLLSFSGVYSNHFAAFS